MNNFTKEELENLNIMLKRVQKDCYTYEFHLLDSLSCKIQSMIDNYCEHECEHESDGYDYFKIGEDELLMDVLKTRKHQLKCRKCKRIYDDNQ